MTSKPIELAANQATAVKFDLGVLGTKTHSLGIRAVDSISGRVLDSVNAELLYPSFAEPLGEATAGLFEFEGLPSGRSFGIVMPGRSDDFAPTPFEVELPRREPLDVTVGPGGACWVEVVDERGDPLEGAGVAVFLENGVDFLRLIKRAEEPTNAEGRLLLEDLPRGTYTLKARWRNTMARGSMEIRGRATSHARIVVPRH